MPGQPSCVWCQEDDHEKCEQVPFIFCNCWRSKHTLDKKDRHSDFRPTVVREYLENLTRSTVMRSKTTPKKGSK